MSRTDIHRPAWALYQDPGMRGHFREFHHHPDGVCDLDVFLQAFCQGRPSRRTNCWVQWWSQQRLCACEMCSMRAARKRARRQERQGTRRQLRDVSGQWAADELDEDAPYPHRADAW